MSFLFQPLSIGDLNLKNRVVMAPMCMYKAVDGMVNEWHLIHYTTRAIGGVGLIIVEATAVELSGRISKDDLGLWSDEQIEGHRILVQSIHGQGAKVGVQLGHAGRKANVGYGRVIGPSEVAFNETYRTPEAMSEQEIKDTVEHFKQAAERALEAGYDVVELHGAHGYLINQFLSPLTNFRTDAYGGDLEHRSRFLIEIIQAVRTVWRAPKPLIIRFSAEEYQAGGNTVAEIIEVCNRIKAMGVDVAHVSSGGVVDVSVKAYPGYQVGFSAEIRRNTQLMTIAGGLVTEAHQANEILSDQSADLIFMGRELLRNPYWCLHAAKTLGVEVTWPAPYERAKL
jgi:NADPH2 dehydrogenase